MDRKVLDVCEPLITSYPHHGGFLSVFFTNEFYIPKLFEYYFQLTYRNDLNRVDFNITTPLLDAVKFIPELEHYIMDRGMLANYNIDYIDFLIKCIDSNYYIYANIDTHYISAASEWNRGKHIIHDAFIFGYDKKQEIFYINEFYGKKYNSYNVSFEDMKKSYIPKSNDDWLSGIHFFKLQENLNADIHY